MTMPKISVIIPLYNKEAIIERSLQSVLSQNYDDFDVIIVNDGSTDHSMDIVRRIKDPRIVLIEQENGGPSKARNTGIKNAKGEWIVFLDADDELLPGALKRFGRLIREHTDANFFACPYYCFNGHETLVKYPSKEGRLENPYKAHFLNTYFNRTGSFTCKKKLAEVHSFNEGLRRYEDLEAWFRMYKDSIIYLHSEPSMVVNTSFVAASHSRKNIDEDFVGHLSFKGKSFWERMCLFKLYLGERAYYEGQIDKKYPTLKYRYDLLLLYKIINLFSKTSN